MTNEQRDSAIAGFKSGYYRAAVNNNVLTTGFDFPEIDLIVMLRPTASTVLWVQMLGRGTRPARGKQDCLVLDFAGNTRKLGPINDPVIPRRKGAGGGTAPVKECPACATWNHASARRCIHCLFEFPIAVKIQETASTQELIRGEVPVVEICAVNHISTIWHQKHGKTPTVKVRYVCGLSTFTEYVCFEHTNYAGVRARHWWKQRALGKEYPFNCDDAILRFEELQRPTHIKVWLNKEYPEILAYCFDGTAFGTLPVPQHIAAPTYTPPAPVQRPVAIDDDEIPF
jgi:DNA repair protein RadD